MFAQVLKVHLSAQPEVYGQASGVTGDKVNKNLLLDAGLQHLYITTEKKVRHPRRSGTQSCDQLGVGQAFNDPSVYSACLL